MSPIQNVESRTTKHKTGCGMLYVTVDVIDGKPIEVFIQNTQCGCQSAINVIARMISARLQNGEDIESVVKPLRKPHCEECIKICAEGKSCWEMVAKELMKYINSSAKYKKIDNTPKLKSPF